MQSFPHWTAQPRIPSLFPSETSVQDSAAAQTLCQEGGSPVDQSMLGVYSPQP